MTALSDAIIRHQAYLEGLKVYAAQQFINGPLKEIDRDMRARLSGLKFNSLDEMTKTELLAFLAQLQRAQYKIYNKYVADLIAFLKDFTHEDHKLFIAMFGALALGKTFTAAQPDILWAYAVGNPIPAAGAFIPDFLNGFVTSSVLSSQRLILKAYANRWTVDQAVAAVNGSKPKKQVAETGTLTTVTGPGIIPTQATQIKSIIATVMQHLSSAASEVAAKQGFLTYIWASVIDSVTTAICMERNGNVYKYGEGPLPPAHYNCRSKPIPFDGTPPDIPKSFGEWIDSQPASVQVDLLGKDTAAKLRGGDITASSVEFGVNSSLSLEQFIAKLPRMLE